MNLLSICCTFRRPEMLKNMLKSWKETRSESSEIIMYLHLDDPHLEEYFMFINEYPHIIDRHRNLQEVINYVVFDLYPGIPYYQIITDDALYHTPGWDKKLIAGFEKHSNGWGFACGRDLVNNDNWHAYQHPSMEIWSWKQAHLLGYVWPRNFDHQGIDFFTKDLALSVNGLAHIPEVVIEHLWFGGCKKKMDANIKEAYSKEAYAGATQAYRGWVKDPENGKGEAVRKIMEARKNER